MSSEEVIRHWWEHEVDGTPAQKSVATMQVPKVLDQTIGSLDMYESPRALRNARAMRVYGQSHVISSPAVDYEYTEARSMIGYPVARSVVDSLHADITSQRPRVMVVPVVTEQPQAWTAYRSARKLERWIDGWMQDASADAMGSRQALDALMFDGGVVKVIESELSLDVSVGEDSVVIERVLPFELRLDPVDAFYGKPRNWYQTRFVPKSWLARRYPEWRADIDRSAPQHIIGLRWMVTHDEDEVALVVDAWHLDSDGRGRMARTCGDAFLEWREWSDPAPFNVFVWTELPVGVWGDAPMNQLMGLQYEINKLMLDMQDAHHLLGKTKILWPDACGTPESYFDDQVGTIIRVQSAAGGLPQPLTPQAVSPELYGYRNQLKSDAYESVGASQIQAQAQIPAQLSGSGKSIEVYQDATSRRQLSPGRRFESARVDVCELALRAARRIGGIKVRTSRGSRIEVLSLADIKLGEQSYALRPYPVSGLSKSIAGNYKEIERWLAMGYLLPQEVIKLMQNPASEQQTAMMLGALDVVMNDLEAIFDGGTIEDNAPDGLYDLSLALVVSARAYLRAKADGAPEDVLEQVQLYIARLKDIETENARVAAQAQETPNGPSDTSGSPDAGTGPDLAGGAPAQPTA